MCFSALAQVKPEDVANEVQADFVDDSFEFFYWHEQPLTFTIAELFKIKGSVSDSLIKQFQENLVDPAEGSKWNCGEISKAKCITDSLLSDVLPSQLSAYPSKSARKKAEKKNKELLKLKVEERRVYRGSFPVYSNGSQFALIKMKYEYGASYYDDYVESIYVLEFQNDRWNVIKEVNIFGK